MTVLIVHGIGGHAGIHWQQWLHDELVKQGHEVVMPDMSNPDQPDRVEWLSEIKNLTKNIDSSDLVVIGHSLGVPVALDLIEQLIKPVRGFVSVAGFANDYGAELNGYFMRVKDIDFAKVKNNIEHAAVIYGDNDPYVTQPALKAVADGLGVAPVIIKNGGHLNTEVGFTQFPKLVEIINGL